MHFLALPAWITTYRLVSQRLAHKAIWRVGVVLLFLLGIFNSSWLAGSLYRNLSVHALSVALLMDHPQLLAQAQSYAEQARVYDPRIADILAYRQGIAHEQMGLGEEAAVFYEKALQGDMLSPAVRGDLLFRLAVYRNGNGQGEVAAAYFKELLAIAPGELPLQTVAHAKVYLGMIIVNTSGDLLLARDYLQAALAELLDPMTMDRYLALITLFREHGGEEYQRQALEMATFANQRQRSSPWTALALCTTHLDLQEYDEAIRWCERALEIDRKNYHARLWLGMIYARQELWEQAVAEYELAASLTTDNAWYLSLAAEARRKLRGE